MRSQRKMLGIGVSLVAVLLMFAGQAPATPVATTQTIGSGDWTNAGIWSGGAVPGSSSVAEVTNGYTVTISTGAISSTALLDSGGTIQLSTVKGAVNNLYMEGGTVNLGSVYWDPSTWGNIFVDASSSFVGTGTAGSDIGRGYALNIRGATATDKVLTLKGITALYTYNGGTTDFAGTYLVQSATGASNESLVMSTRGGTDVYSLSGNFALDPLNGGGRVQVGKAAGTRTYAKTLSGTGVWANWGTMTFASGAIVRPGSASAADAATLRLQGWQLPASTLVFDTNSDVVMDIMSDNITTGSDKLLLMDEQGRGLNAAVTINSGAKLDIDLFTPLISTTITNMVLWDDGTGTIAGDYLTGGGIITYHNLSGGAYDAGWTGLSVAKGSTNGGTNNQLLFSGTYTAGSAPVPEPATLLLVGTGVLGVFGYIRRRRMS